MQDFIKEYWNGQATQHLNSHEASWGDYFMLDLEVENIGKYLRDGQTVLDVGCANGYSSFKQIEKHCFSKFVGIDFSEAMISEAIKEKERRGYDDNIVNFDNGDIRCINYSENTFDVVYTTRVLINLPTWEEQIIGISECLRVAKQGGIIILSEAFWEPLVLLNALRSLKQLPPLVEHDFNRYLKQTKLETYLSSKGYNFINEDFSSIYYLGSRFLRELVTNPSDYPGFSNPINKIFFEIEKSFSGGGFGIQQIYVISK